MAQIKCCLSGGWSCFPVEHGNTPKQQIHKPNSEAKASSERQLSDWPKRGNKREHRDGVTA